MSLTTSEVDRIKTELGFNLLQVGATPYIGVSQVFEQVIQPYLTSGTNTTSSTAVTAATTATPATLTLASATGFAALARVVVDVDDREEVVTVQSVLGSTITVLLKNAHTGTYPVILEGAESIVRDILRQIRKVQTQLGSTAITTAGLKRVDVLEWWGNSKSTSQIGMLQDVLMYWRDQLASALFDVSLNIWRRRASAGQMLSVY